MKKYFLFFLMIFIIVFSSSVYAQMFQQNQWSFQVNGGLNYPLGEMSNWFKSTYNVTGGFTQGLSNKIAIEYRIHYTNFDKEGDKSSTKYTRPDDLDLYFRSVGFTFNFLYNLTSSSSAIPFIILGGGLYRWDSKRGEGMFGTGIIAAKVRSEYGFGFNAGLGLAIAAGQKTYVDINVRWEGIMETLWPTLYLGLENVQPIQALGINAGIRFLL